VCWSDRGNSGDGGGGEVGGAGAQRLVGCAAWAVIWIISVASVSDRAGSETTTALQERGLTPVARYSQARRPAALAELAARAIRYIMRRRAVVAAFVQLTGPDQGAARSA